MTSSSGSNTTRLRIAVCISSQSARDARTTSVRVNKSNNIPQP